MIHRQDRQYSRIDRFDNRLELRLNDQTLLDIIYRNHPINEDIVNHTANISYLMKTNMEFHKQFLKTLAKANYNILEEENVFNIGILENKVYLTHPFQVIFPDIEIYEQLIQTRVSDLSYSNAMIAAKLADTIYKENNPNSLKGKIDLLFPSPLGNKLYYLTDEEIEVYG